MGCAVGGVKDGDLRDARRQVEELQRIVETREKENLELRRKLEETQPPSCTSDALVEPMVTLLPGSVGDTQPEMEGTSVVPESGDCNLAEQTLVHQPPEDVEDDRELVGELPGTDPPAPAEEDEEEQAQGPVKTIELQPLLAQSQGHDSEASTCAPGAMQLSAVVCHQCRVEGVETFLDASDMNRYCEACWEMYYGAPPNRSEVQPLVPIEVVLGWPKDRLARIWAEVGLSGWPPPAVIPQQLHGAEGDEGELWSTVSVRVRKDIVGPHARDHVSGTGIPRGGEILAGRYVCKSMVGEGHFTKAFLADDLQSGTQVCLKRHRNLSVEALADLMVLARRLKDVDEGGKSFPQLTDAFFDLVGYTVESLVEGRNCYAIAHSDQNFFDDMRSLRQVAQGALQGLVLLDRAGIVHNDMKSDNLIWVGPQLFPEGGCDTEDDQGRQASLLDATVRIVDFGCARLDQREEHGRNWSLAEGGAGHIGKWSPEMTLRLPITHRSDVWGLAVSLCELHCGRMVWRNEADTAEVVLAQALGLCNLRDGVPSSLLRRSPLDVRLLYTPAPKHLPLRRNVIGQLEALQPIHWGLDQVLGGGWCESRKSEFGDFLQTALIMDPALRPSATQLIQASRFLAAPPSAASAIAST